MFLSLLLMSFSLLMIDWGIGNSVHVVLTIFLPSLGRKFVQPLQISTGLHSYFGSSSGYHRSCRVWFIVDFTVSTKWGLAMFLGILYMITYQFPWALFFEYSSFIWKCIQKHCNQFVPSSI